MLAETWTVTIEASVFAGDMDSDSVKVEAQRQLDLLLEGSDFLGVQVQKVKRDNL